MKNIFKSIFYGKKETHGLKIVSKGRKKRKKFAILSMTAKGKQKEKKRTILKRTHIQKRKKKTTKQPSKEQIKPCE